MGKCIEGIELVCLCPVRNEGWIIENFCRLAQTWADRIHLLDQRSTDATVEIAKRFPNVIVQKNLSEEFNEANRQLFLIDAARESAQERLVFIALDADEFLDPNFPSEQEKEALSRAPSGSVLLFDWLQVLPDQKTAFSIPRMPFGYVDDGATHEPQDIHSTRVPAKRSSGSIFMSDSGCFHVQLVNLERFKQKQRWYQAFEIFVRSRDPISVYRQYHKYQSWFDHPKLSIPRSATDIIGGIPLIVDEFPWWYSDIKRWLTEDRGKRLGYADIWDVPWLDHVVTGADIGVPSFPQTLTVYWLRKTQKYRDNILIRVVDSGLRTLFFK